jgi:hypothetical protein
MKPVVAGFALLIVIGVLAYGYWFGVTHGSLYITVMDVSDREHPRDTRPVQLLFQDSTGKVLAQATASESGDPISVIFPAMYSCREIEKRSISSPEAREDWATCFERQSRWLPKWVWNATFVEIRSSSCTIYRMPVSVSEHPDTWWLWWVPLRHIGGRPYTSFSFLILYNRTSCAWTVHRTGSTVATEGRSGAERLSAITAHAVAADEIHWSWP